MGGGGGAVATEVGTASQKSSANPWRLTQNWSQKEMKIRGGVNPGRKADWKQEQSGQMRGSLAQSQRQNVGDGSDF